MVTADANGCCYMFNRFAQSGFLDHFKPNATVHGAIVSSYYGGVILGLLAIATIAQKIGRRRSIQLGGVIGLIGAIMQAASTKLGSFFAGRVIAGASAGIMLTTVNVYQSEIAPPDHRGAMVAFQLKTLTTTGALASWMGYACNFAINPEFSWRFPIALKALPALGLIIGCFFIPFSPRWSYGNGGVAMVMVFIFFFGTISPMPYTYSAEILPTKIRATGFAVAPIALADITWRFRFIFIGCNLFFLPIVYFFFPETRKLTWEEVSRVFGETVKVEMADITDENAEKVVLKSQSLPPLEIEATNDINAK
ncbi:hypothetical protein PV11_08590 [Exophiala sideris]|uniref:Major facilitator superfamily (MFS) profile domain-containing protein n=1 Tax=Exophiala sideris TaxID=1016849 RepID=A0A0D1X111_9EURO|nr:hypothetical protein PV11_08590 [Exophiala sideris]